VDDLYPTPNTNDMLQKFHGTTIFSKFDIIKAFFNVEVDEATKPLLTIITRKGTFTWNRMPFGHKNCPAVWARASDLAFEYSKDLIKYVDDMVIASKSENGKTDIENHFIAIIEFFERLKLHNMKIKISKTDFFKDEISFLGNTITKNGIKPDDKYIKKILQFRPPTNLKELRMYSGCIEWISKFVYNLKELMLPLRPLLKQKKIFVWKQQHQNAFNRIQNIIQEAQLLTHPDFTQPFYIHTDSSDYSYGAILLQKDQKHENNYTIIDMFSKYWPETHATLHITSKELLAVINAIKRWKNFLSTKKFTISTDSNNIPHLFKMNDDKLLSSSKHLRWIDMLSEFNFEVKYIKGIENKVADFLSRIQSKDLEHFRNGNTQIQLFQHHTDTDAILTDCSILLHNIDNTILFDDIIPINSPYATYYYDKLLKTDNDVLTIQQQYLNSKFEDDVSSATSTSSEKGRREERNAIIQKRQNETQKRKLNEEIIDRIDEIISDHESSMHTHDSFRYEDIQRNHAILKDEILANILLQATNNTPNIFDRKLIKINQEADPLAQIIINVINGDHSQHIDLPKYVKTMIKQNKVYINKEGILMVKLKNDIERYYTPKNHRFALMKYYHESALKGHQGSDAVIYDIKLQFYWPEMDKDIKQYVKYCNICQKAKRGPKNKFGFQKLWTSKYFNHVIAIDHKGPLAKTKSGNKYITTIIDRFSGYAVCIAIPRINAYTTAWNLINYWICRFGIPYGILSDQGTDFMSGIVDAICKMLGMKHKISSAYNPQSNGKVERFNRILSDSMKVIAHERNLNFNQENGIWDLYLPFISAAHNNRTSRTTGKSPNELVYGKKITLPHQIDINDIDEKIIKNFKGYINNIKRLNEQYAKDHLVQYDNKRNIQYNKKRINKTYKLGDLVQFIQGPINIKGNEKYNPNRWSEVYKISKVYPSKLTYDLTKQNDSRIVALNINIKKLIPYTENTNNINQNQNSNNHNNIRDEDDEKAIYLSDDDVITTNLSIIATQGN
jgi:hypothetical protein